VPADTRSDAATMRPANATFNVKEISMVGKLSPSRATTAQGSRIVGSERRSTSGPGPEVMAASTLDSDKVLSVDGEEIGKVKEIMLDVQSGMVAYAVMSSGGFLGIGDKLLAIPWSALTLDTDRKCFLLPISAERVKHAPGFDKDHWPLMADPAWATDLHEYYGSEPYWLLGGYDREDLGASDLDPDLPERDDLKR
jgi:sporulation protein YlmC with PRC-barrel domain